MRQAYTLDSAVCPVLSPTHPHAAYLIVTGLYPETQGRLTMVDSQVCRATLCSSILVTLCSFFRDGFHPPLAAGFGSRGFCFKCLIMSQVFCI